MQQFCQESARLSRANIECALCRHCQFAAPGGVHDGDVVRKCWP